MRPLIIAKKKLKNKVKVRGRHIRGRHIRGRHIRGRHIQKMDTITIASSQKFLFVTSLIFALIPVVYSLYHSLVVHALFGSFITILSTNHHYMNDFVIEFNSPLTSPIWSVYGCYLVYNIASTASIFNLVFHIYIASHVILVYKIAMIQFEYSKLHGEEKWVSFYVYYLAVLSVSQILCVWNVVTKHNH